MVDLVENLAKIKDLTESVTPFRATIIGTNLLDSTGSKKGILLPIIKNEEIAVVRAEVEAGFIHARHFHEEYEILYLLNGSVVVNFDDGLVELEPHKPYLIDIGKPHEVCYLTATNMLTVTIPGSPDFPNIIGYGNGRK